MTDISLTSEVVIDAPVHTVFEYCRDPRRIYAGDPTHEVNEVDLASEGVGTTAQVVDSHGLFQEVIPIEYLEVVPDERIVFDAHPRASLKGLNRWTFGSRHTWTWTFAAADGGTRLTVDVLEHDAPRFERVMDAVTRGAGTRMFSKEIDGRLGRIKEATENGPGSAG